MKGENLAVKNPVPQPQVTKRSAVIICSKTTAVCPINAECINTDPETRSKTICGHYAGSLTNLAGSQVYCEYSE
jgi:hypothetical protein